jgi:hypothetical protein
MSTIHDIERGRQGDREDISNLENLIRISEYQRISGQSISVSGYEEERNCEFRIANFENFVRISEHQEISGQSISVPGHQEERNCEFRIWKCGKQHKGISIPGQSPIS